jgi:hypothetical protein
MTEPNVTPAIVTPTSAVLVFIAPTLVTVAQVVSGNPSSGLWALLEGGLAILCVLYAVVIPWFATRSFRKMRAAFASENEQGVARIVAMRSSARRYGRFAVLLIDSSGIRTFRTSTSGSALAWSEVASMGKIQTGTFGRESVMVWGQGGECLLDFILMGNSGINQLRARHLDDYVTRIVRLRESNSQL